MFSPASFAADVVVITDSRHPVRTMGGEQLIELDEAPRIEAELRGAARRSRTGNSHREAPLRSGR